MDLTEKRKQLVEQLIFEGRIKSKEVKDAFLSIPREYFIQEEYESVSYTDTPLKIEVNQTISAPHMVAIMVEELDLKKGQRILEIGSGSGYHAAIVSHIIGKTGHVYTIERIKDLVENAKENIKKAGIENVSVIHSDGSEGYKEKAPYDRIYVTCASPDVPDPLTDQLNENGKMLIPVGRLFCQLLLIEKKKNKITKKNLGGCAFVPLIGKYGF
jgi:protein-L-isoaspartate(D-aspartate) O-methyltransferase